MGIFDKIGLTNRGRTQGARDTVAQYMTTLAGVDCHGIPPLSIYQRFNSVGAEFHGQCAVAQGACGYRFGGNIKVDFAKLIPAISPLTASGEVKLSAARLPTSAILLYRLPGELTANDVLHTPLALAQMDGINWTFDSSATVTVGAKTEAFDKLASLNLTVAAGAKYKYLSTKLVSFETQHFARANVSDLAFAVDKILGVEIKKTLANILDHHESEKSKTAKAAGLEVGKTKLTEYAKEKKDDLIAISKSAYSELRRGVGYEYLAAGFVVGATLGVAGKAAYDGYLNYKDSKLDTQTHDLYLELGKKVRALSAAELAGSKGKGLKAALDRITNLRNAFLEERIYGGTSSPDIGEVPKVTTAHLERTDETALTLTSHEYGGKLTGTAALNISKYTESETKTADLTGQKLDFRFQVRGANNMMLIQDTHANFMQMTRDTAYKSGLSLTGVKALDKKLEKKAKDDTKKTPGVPHVFGGRRFGALRYRAASVYLKNDGTANRRAVPGVSGISMGVSVRAPRLITHAKQCEKLLKSKAAADDFENWVCLHLGCQPAQLREFLKDTILPFCEIDKDGKTTFKSDALLIEANYGLEAKDLPNLKMDPYGAPIDLFAHMNFSTAQGFQNDVSAGNRKLSSMRLRYRIQTPLKDTAKTFFSLGMPLDEHLPLTMNLEFGSNKEVGQESIVDLATWFSPEIRAAATSEFEKNEMSVPPVVLFNRC